MGYRVLDICYPCDIQAAHLVINKLGGMAGTW